MLRIIVLVLCAFACSTAAARGVGARGDVRAAPRADEAGAGAYPRDEHVAPVTRYRARQDIADSDYLGAAMDDDNVSDDSGNNSNGNGNGYGGGGGGGAYTGGGGGGGGGGSPGATSYAPSPPMSFSGTVHGSYGGGGGHDGNGCVYKGVMTDAEIATCKAASIAWMRRSGKK